MSPHTHVILKTIGIDLWYDRNNLIETAQPVSGGLLAILLYRPIQTSAERKILKGMLSVLELKPHEWWLGWINPRWKTWSASQFWRLCQTLNPTALLWLGQAATTTIEPLGTLACNLHSIYTYHPQELLEKPENKRKAYQALLSLKADLQRRQVIQ